MAVGNADMLATYFPKPVDANYFVGELYISNNNIEPSGSRDGLRPSPEKDIFEGLIREKFKELNKIYNQLSKLASGPLKNLVDSHITKERQAILLDGGSDGGDTNEFKDAKKAFVSAKAELKKKLDEIDKDSDKKNLADQIIQSASKKAHDRISKENASSKLKKPIEYIQLASVVDNVRKEKEEKPSDTETKQTEGDNVTQDNPVKENSQPKEVKDTDVFKVLGKAEWGLMKIVYNVLDRDTKLDPISRERIKRKLVSRLVKDDA